MRQNWSDDRIDGLDRKVDEGFRHVDQRFDQVDKRFEQIDGRFERLEGQFDSLRGEVNARLESLEQGMRGLHRTLVLFSLTMLATVVGLCGTLLTITLTQL